MPVTAGHGNPVWTRDETILALDLYLRCDKIVPPPSDPRIQELSKLLNAMPWPSHVKRNDKFRNAAGVGMKLLNLRSAETGKGLSNSEMDRVVVSEFSGRERTVRELADAIRSVLNSDTRGLGELYSEDDVEFVEGRLLTSVHKRRERHPGLRQRLLAQRRSQQALRCDICSWTHGKLDASYEAAAFEAHHLKPLSMDLTTATKISDLTLLCATCHRLVHRAIVLERRWLTLEECSAILHGKDR